MKTLLLILSLSMGLISCSPSLSKDNQVRLKKKVNKKTLSYTSKKEKKWSRETLIPSSSKLVKDMDLTVEEKDKIAKKVQAGEMMGANGIDIELDKYHLKVVYKAPHDGFVEANDQYFSSKPVLNEFVAQEIKKQTTKKVCTKRHRRRFSTRSSCVKYKRVKLEDAAKKEKGVKSKYSNAKIYKNGDSLTKDYILRVASTKVNGTEQIKLNLSNPNKREIASLED